MSEKKEILNLYAGIGGNRKLWDEVTDIKVTAVEIDEKRAKIYQDFFPDDKIIVRDAHNFLIENMKDYDFIWSSPPCPTHSRAKHGGKLSGINNLEYPNMELYEEIILLKNYFAGKYCVENVISYYDPLIKPKKMNDHFFWSNYKIPEKVNFDRGGHHYSGIEKLQEYKGFDLSKYRLSKKEKKKILRNCIHPKLGKHILECAFTKQQTDLDSIEGMT